MSASVNTERHASLSTICSVEETAPLITQRTPQKRLRKLFKNFCSCDWIIKNRGAVCVLSWVALVQCFDPVVTISITGIKSHHNDIERIFDIYTAFSFFFYLFYPIMGLYADIKFGRRKISLFFIVVGIICTLLVTAGRVLANELNFSLVSLTVFSIGFIVGNLADTIFVIVMAMHGFEQLTGATSQELSAYAHWYYWCRIFGRVVTVPVVCLVSFEYGVIIIYSLHIGCLLIVLVSGLFSKKIGIVEMKAMANPLTQMARILKFAKKHKYPLNRSALTYWEETGPSRLDLGKEKYGGPFTEEEVEDVKTFFKLLPVVICMVIFVIIVDQFNSYFFLAKGDDEFDVTNCMVSSVYFINSLSLLATMLIYHIFKPLFDKCLRTMLRRIGFGITLALLTELVWLSVDASGHYYYSQLNQTCIFETPVNFTINDQWEINNLWIILPKVAMGVAFGIALPTTLEFVFAQAPHSMKGLMIGVWFMVSGCVQMIGFNLHYPFILLKNIYPNCTFYYYLTKTSIVAISLVCFIGLAVWYKPRERERHFYPHLTVENFYENDFRRRDSYHQDRKRRRLRGEQVDEIDADTIDIHAYLDNQSKISNLK